jgi:hypothetical protein
VTPAVAQLHSCLDLSALVLGKYAHLFYLLVAAMRPRMLMTCVLLSCHIFCVDGCAAGTTRAAMCSTFQCASVR